MNYILLAPEGILSLFGLLMPLLDTVIKKQRRILRYWSLAGFLISLLALLGIIGARGTIWGGILIVDSFAVFFKIIFLAVSILIALGSMEYIKENEGEYYTLLIFAVLGMMLVASSGELITLYVSLELATISTFALVGFFKKNPNSGEAAIKYFIISALSSAIIVFGMSLIYGITGSTKIYVISQTLENSVVRSSFTPALILGTILLLAGFGFEIAAVPFHMWLPDTYEGAPTIVTAFMAAGIEAMGFAAVFRIFGVSLAAISLDWKSLFTILAVLTLILGNIVPLAQKSVKRLLAYSCVGQAGYILIGLAVASHLGYTGGIFHLLTYAFMKGGAFLAAGLVYLTLSIDDIEDYAGLRDRAPVTAFCMIIFLLSLAGVPPLAGFWSKFVIFAAAIQAGETWLAVLGVITSAISLYYYARIIKSMYLLPSKNQTRIREAESRNLLIAILIALSATVLIGLYPDPFITLASKAALFR